MTAPAPDRRGPLVRRLAELANDAHRERELHHAGKPFALAHLDRIHMEQAVVRRALGMPYMKDRAAEADAAKIEPQLVDQSFGE